MSDLDEGRRSVRMQEENLMVLRILAHLRSGGGTLSISYETRPAQDDPWVVAYEFGAEAPDSPMAAAAAYGMGKSLDEALKGVAGDLGWDT